MTKVSPIGIETRIRLGEIQNELIELENELVRVMQHKLAHSVGDARWTLFAVSNGMAREEMRLELPF